MAGGAAFFSLWFSWENLAHDFWSLEVCSSIEAGVHHLARESNLMAGPSKTVKIQALRHRGGNHLNCVTDSTKLLYQPGTRYYRSSERLWSSAEGLLRMWTTLSWASTSAAGKTNTWKAILKISKELEAWKLYGKARLLWLGAQD